MKKYLILLFSDLFFVGCVSFTVTWENDTFNGAEVVTADMWHTVVDSSIDNRRVLYRKEIVRGVVSDPVVSFNFVAYPDSDYHYHGESINPEAYILADKKSFPVRVYNIEKRACLSGDCGLIHGFSILSGNNCGFEHTLLFVGKDCSDP